MKSLSRAQLFATPWTVAYYAPPSMKTTLNWKADINVVKSIPEKKNKKKQKENKMYSCLPKYT